MSLLQISEPGQTAAPHQQRVAVGIDLGTTHSLVAAVRSGVAETLPDEKKRHLLPSVVHYGQHGIDVGYIAQQCAAKDPKNTISSAKRFMGRKLTDINPAHFPYQFTENEKGLPYIDTAQGSVNPIQVSAEILKSLASRAEKTLGEKLDGVVITVPAYFNDAQRQATKDAASIAGLHVLRLLNEPTAAAIAYGLDSQQEGIIAVYDLGGGTFDISILCLNRGVFEVLSTGGDSALGGDDFDQQLIEYFRSQNPAWQNNDDPYLLQSLRQAAIDIKHALSDKTEACVNIGEQQLIITREKFNELISFLIKKTLLACHRALKDAQLMPQDVLKVVMVGGSTRVPGVREAVGKFFSCQPLTSLDPDRVVAIGAAIQADILMGNKPDSDLLLLDVIPLSLGIETMGGLVEKIIPRNTTIPCARAQEFTTFKDGQTAMMIHVVQGERELVSECRSLAHFTLRGITPRPAGSIHIRVTFQVDADGLLSVTAMDKLTGIQTAIQVKPSYGLTDKEIITMIQDSMNYAQEDMELRKLAEAKVEAQRVIESVESALTQDSSLLKEDELQKIHSALSELKDKVNQPNLEHLLQATARVDNVTQAFAAQRMDHKIRQALAGQSVNEL